MFVFLFVGLLMSAVMSAFMINSHPVFFVASVIMLIFLMFLGNVFGDMYSAFGNTAFLQEGANLMTYMNLIMENITLLMAGGGFLVFIVLFGKRGNNV